MKKEINCEHQLDKNHKYCVKCGCPVISETFRKATPEEQKEWLENPQEFLKKKDLLTHLDLADN